MNIFVLLVSWNLSMDRKFYYVFSVNAFDVHEVLTLQCFKKCQCLCNDLLQELIKNDKVYPTLGSILLKPKNA